MERIIIKGLEKHYDCCLGKDGQLVIYSRFSKRPLTPRYKGDLESYMLTLDNDIRTHVPVSHLWYAYNNGISVMEVRKHFYRMAGDSLSARRGVKRCGDKMKWIRETDEFWQIQKRAMETGDIAELSVLFMSYRDKVVRIVRNESGAPQDLVEESFSSAVARIVTRTLDPVKSMRIAHPCSALKGYMLKLIRAYRAMKKGSWNFVTGVSLGN